jgi:hypothetical protein
VSGRIVVVALGGAAALAGLAIAIRPSLTTGFSPTYVVVTLVGVLALLQAVGAALARRRGERRRADLPEVERRRSFPQPGTAFDERLAALPRWPGRRADRQRRIVRDELREVAEETLVRYGGLAPTEATERIESGTWTEDPRAAWFLAPDAAIGVPLTERVRDALGVEYAFGRRARATVAELAAYTRTERSDGDGRTAVEPAGRRRTNGDRPTGGRGDRTGGPGEGRDERPGVGTSGGGRG